MTEDSYWKAQHDEQGKRIDKAATTVGSVMGTYCHTQSDGAKAWEALKEEITKLRIAVEVYRDRENKMDDRIRREIERRETVEKDNAMLESSRHEGAQIVVGLAKAIAILGSVCAIEDAVDDE